MHIRSFAVAMASLVLGATTALAADIPTNIGGAGIPASASGRMLEKLGFTDLNKRPEVKGTVLQTTGKWEGRDVELRVNLQSGQIEVLKEGPAPGAAAIECLSFSADLDFEQPGSGDLLHKCLVQQDPDPESGAGQCLQLAEALDFEEVGPGKLLRDCLVQKVGS